MKDYRQYIWRDNIYAGIVDINNQCEMYKMSVNIFCTDLLEYLLN
jgi:hypothetical protein